MWPNSLSENGVNMLRSLSALSVILERRLVVPALLLSVATLCAETPNAWTDKVEPALLTQAVAGDTEFLVMLAQQADLSGASSLPSKRQKGEYVFKRLTEVAQSTQGPLLTQLKAQGVEHRAFWIANMVWVRGSLDTVCSLAQREDVGRLMVNGSLGVINPPVPTNDPPRPYDIGSNLQQVRAPEVWALGYTGQGVVIGGQDTGYQWDHPALKRSYRGWDGTNVNHN